jgi:hypothetical protein
MKDAQVLDLLRTDPSLFNARYYKDAESATRHIAEHHDPSVTRDQVERVMAPMKVHPGTGEVME